MSTTFGLITLIEWSDHLAGRDSHEFVFLRRLAYNGRRINRDFGGG